MGKQGKTVNHNPPLVFDLSVDQAESTPINASTELIAQLDAARNATLADIASTVKHDGHYMSGGKEAWGCCNPKSEVCRCKGQDPGLVG